MKMHDRTPYRRVRLLTGGVVPFLLALALLLCARFGDSTWEPGYQVAGICRELLAGTTEGRQALLGSCWVAPLPVLVYLPFAWLLPEPLAGWAAFFAVWLFAFWSVREAIKATGQSGWRIVLAQAALAAMLLLTRQPSMLQTSAPLTLGLMLLGTSSLADWAAFRRLRDVVGIGAAASFLLLCGFPFFVPAAMLVIMAPLVTCGKAASRVRFMAWLLLAWLPVVYTLGVWLLVNRLILGDALFFLRSLNYMVPHSGAFVLTVLLPAVVLAPALLVVWFCDARREEESGAGLTAAATLLLALALLTLGQARALDHFDLDWSTELLHACFLAIMLMALVRLRQPLYRLTIVLVLFVAMSVYWFKPQSLEAAASKRAEICRAVEAYVKERTPYGRIFVIGYAGLDLLRDYQGDMMLPNLDLHIGSLRRAYKGQNLYLLVPEPKGAAHVESVFWKHPDIYLHGGDRLLFSGAFDSWHLFEVISAPTREQLDEWKKSP